MCLFFWQGEDNEQSAAATSQRSGGLSRVQSMADGRDHFFRNLIPSFRKRETPTVPPIIT